MCAIVTLTASTTTAWYFQLYSATYLKGSLYYIITHRHKQTWLTVSRWLKKIRFQRENQTFTFLPIVQLPVWKEKSVSNVLVLQGKNKQSYGNGLCLICLSGDLGETFRPFRTKVDAGLQQQSGASLARDTPPTLMYSTTDHYIVYNYRLKVNTLPGSSQHNKGKLLMPSGKQNCCGGGYAGGLLRTSTSTHLNT